MKSLVKFIVPTNHSLKTQVILVLTIAFVISCFALVIILPSTEYYSSLRQYQKTLFISLAVLYIFLMIFFIIVFAKPLRTITKYVDEAKAYEFREVNAPKISNKEFKLLLSKFHELTSSLTATIHTLDTKNKAVAKYTEELNTEHQLKKELVASISHEIKTPLTSVGIIINSILDGIFEGEEIFTELRAVLGEIDSLNNMLQQIVSLYQLEGTSFQLKLEKNYISNLLNHALSSCQQVAINYKQSISFSNNDFIVYVDTQLMVRALKNILFNAITYSPTNSKIEIITKDIRFHNILEIVNYGVNIDESEIGKLFEPFYRVDKARTKNNDSGNGLGLYIVAQTLRKHKIEFDITNIPNGVKFFIRFPKVKH